MKHTANLCIYTSAHFLVDFVCFFILFSGISVVSGSMETTAWAFLWYNLLAFGLQPIIGFLADIGKIRHCGSIGCLLVAVSIPFCRIAWMIALLLAALGNAAFHIGGGIDSLVHAKGKMARSGIFVSSGALGVTLGTLTGKSFSPTPLLVIGMVLVLAVFSMFIFTNSERKQAHPAICEFSFPPSVVSSGSWIILLSFLAIVIRSFAGNTFVFHWGSDHFLLMMLPAVCAVVGKASGGLLADRFGARRVAVISLLACIPLLLFGASNVWLSILGITGFHITMAITLCVIANQTPSYPGFAFGLTTLALLLGTIPTYFVPLSDFIKSILLIVLTGAAAICTYFSAPPKHTHHN